MEDDCKANTAQKATERVAAMFGDRGDMIKAAIYNLRAHGGELVRR